MSIRVMVYGKLHRQEDIDSFTEGFVKVSQTVKGTPGHIKDELLRDPAKPLHFILLSEWSSREDFLRWAESPMHREATTPIRPYWQLDGERKIFDIAVRLDN